jgi:hypothetical protein
MGLMRPRQPFQPSETYAKGPYPRESF